MYEGVEGLGLWANQEVEVQALVGQLLQGKHQPRVAGSRNCKYSKLTL